MALTHTPAPQGIHCVRLECRDTARRSCTHRPSAMATHQTKVSATHLNSESESTRPASRGARALGRTVPASISATTPNRAKTIRLAIRGQISWHRLGKWRCGSGVPRRRSCVRRRPRPSSLMHMTRWPRMCIGVPGPWVTSRVCHSLQIEERCQGRYRGGLVCSPLSCTDGPVCIEHITICIQVHMRARAHGRVVCRRHRRRLGNSAISSVPVYISARS